MNKIKFKLDGCDISFIAEAPEDITLKQLLKQCNKIEPDWCRCGINSNDIEDYEKVEIEIDYDSIRLINEPPCKIIELEGVDNNVED